MPADSELAVTEDAFLGGRLCLAQPARGYRAGIDAVMLAAAIPAQAGARVLDAGCGVGVATLCLAARIEDAQVTGIEVEPALCELAHANAQRNGMGERVSIVEADVTAGRAAAGLAAESFDHVMANPPFYDRGRARLSDDPLKARAHAHDADDLDLWVRFAVAVLAPRGTLTMIHRADALGAILKALERRFGGCRVLPLFARAGEAASRVVVRGEKGSRAPLSLLSGLVLHGQGNGFTAPAEAVLRHGAALAMA
jgi:tRNA1(Val) A37 N6-methylase TrmN6